MPVSVTDFLTGVYGQQATGQALTGFQNPNSTVQTMPYTDNGSGSQSFSNGSGTTIATSPTYTNPE